MTIAEAALSGAGIALGGIGVYVRLTMKAFIVDTLNGRYPTRELVQTEFRNIHEAIRDLPCKNHTRCQ